MNKVKLTLATMLLGGAVFAQTQCTSLTKDSAQCKNQVKQGHLCYLHNPNYVKPSESEAVICSGTTKKNAPCKSRTRHSSGKCHHHRD
tara:strand:+ start:522 stop:785 length:264 start_codon:yes stop_codon:yes gene_type:complete